MGQAASRVYGALVKRPLQRYNVDHRAAKVIAKIEDPKAPAIRSPMYQSDREVLERIRETNPTLADSALRKDSEFDTRLRDVFVTSRDPASAEHAKKEVPENPTRPLPLDRTQYSEDFIPALLRVDSRRPIPRGKVTLEQVVSFLTEHAGKPELYTAQAISDSFRLNPVATANTLKYVKVFKAHLPEPKVKKEFDPLQAGKDWVDDVKQGEQSAFQYSKQREERLKLLKAQEANRQKQQELLSDGSRTNK